MSKAAVKDQKVAPKTPAKPRRPLSIKPQPLRPAPEAPAPTDPSLTDIIGPVCVHRWVIESPNGETSKGRCRHCGAEKEFPNAAEDGLWERNVPQSRWTGRSDWSPKDSGY
jgi:hypothetical protein